MRTEILKAVAQPPKFLLAPMVPAIVNMGVQLSLLFVAVGIFGLNPLFFVTTILLSHAALIGAGVKEPHLSTMLQAYGQTYKRTTNLYGVKGNKFQP